MKCSIKLAAALAALLLAQNAFAKNARFDGSSYSISLDYNESVFPGDPVFVRMRFENVRGRKKSFSPEAKAELKVDQKIVGTSAFYAINPKKSPFEFMAGLPISSWAKSGECQIAVSYSTGEGGEKTFTLPLYVQEKEFESGVIALTQNMSNISKNTSPEKVAQSKKLNDIINSVNPDGVWTLKRFVLPVKSTRRTTAFAERIIYKYPGGKESATTHAGIDFGVPTGTEVVAPAAGKVLLAENRISTGWTIIVEHLPGLYSMYYHMSQLKVKEGQSVQQGELLGLSGATGFATGPHLHWEIRLNSVIVNPDYFISEDWSFNEP